MMNSAHTRIMPNQRRSHIHGRDIKIQPIGNWFCVYISQILNVMSMKEVYRTLSAKAHQQQQNCAVVCAYKVIAAAILCTLYCNSTQLHERPMS